MGDRDWSRPHWRTRGRGDRRRADDAPERGYDNGFDAARGNDDGRNDWRRPHWQTRGRGDKHRSEDTRERGRDDSRPNALGEKHMESGRGGCRAGAAGLGAIPRQHEKQENGVSLKQSERGGRSGRSGRSRKKKGGKGKSSEKIDTTRLFQIPRLIIDEEKEVNMEQALKDIELMSEKSDLCSPTYAKDVGRYSGLPRNKGETWRFRDQYDHQRGVRSSRNLGYSLDYPITKYQHLGDSDFKVKFLDNITGSIHENLERCLYTRTALCGDRQLDAYLKDELLEKQANPKYQNMQAIRERLPTFARKHEIIDIIECCQVCVINGETGCGKTTQVVQYILDDYILNDRGSRCCVVCTQPRRISAISVAGRVAEERVETCGRSVGYQVRLERAMPRKTGSILFCTTGVLLQCMQSDPALTKVSHLVLDEIHERDTSSDFVLTILKDVIQKRPELRVILMSATLDAAQFSQYYGNCPHLHIPGFAFPVTEYYLEDIIEMTKFDLHIHSRRYPRSFRSSKNMEFERMIKPYIRELRIKKKYPEWVLEGLAVAECEDVCLELIVDLVKYISQNLKEGAILVFLPGWDKISTLNKLLTEGQDFPTTEYLVLPLHSQMPTTAQKTIFDRPPNGIRKIVLSTNIAESSITIDDVVYVINTGKAKMKNFDLDASIATLQTEWISKASARQRRGRAGRVQDGVCFHTYSRAREATLTDYTPPEMLRTSLEEIILQIKILQLGQVKPVLERVLDPPDPRAVTLSVKILQGMNALDEYECLTPLGYHLAKLPLDPRTGKMILMGALFSCVDPVFSVAAALNFKDAFMVPVGLEDEVNQIKDDLSCGMKSDHWVLAEVIRRWENAERNGRGRTYSKDHYLSSQTLNLLRDMKVQFAEALRDMKFLSSTDPKAESSNRHSQNIGLVRSIICAGLYPNVAILQSLKVTMNGIPKIKMMTPEDGRVFFHPRSINERQCSFENNYFVYFMKLKSSQIYLHDATMVHPLALIFFGRDCRLTSYEGWHILSISKDIEFRCTAKSATVLKALRQKLVNLLEYKITHPGIINWDSNNKEVAVLRAVIEALTSEEEEGLQYCPRGRLEMF